MDRWTDKLMDREMGRQTLTDRWKRDRQKDWQVNGQTDEQTDI